MSMLDHFLTCKAIIPPFLFSCQGFIFPYAVLEGPRIQKRRFVSKVLRFRVDYTPLLTVADDDNTTRLKVKSLVL